MEYIKTTDGKNQLITLKGKFTFADHESFRDVINTIKMGKIKSITLDLANVDFIDSAALGMLLIAREEAEKTHVNLILQNPSGQIHKMFKVSKFDTLFTIVHGKAAC